jgi:NitT/TauT family transport system substrate-binding protein
MTLSVRAAVAPAIKPLAEATRLEIDAGLQKRRPGMRIMQSRRHFLSTLSAAGAASVMRTRASLADEGPPETTTVRIVRQVGSCIAPQYVAEELLRADGFADVRFVQGQPTAKWVGLGKADFSLSMAPTILFQYEAGLPVIALAGVHIGCFELFVHEPIRTISDLRGKTVDTTDPYGSGAHLLMAIMAASVGLDLRTDINWMASGGLEQSIELFAQGKSDAYLASAPDGEELRARKLGKVILNTTIDPPWSQYYCCMLAANAEYVRNYPVATKRVVRAILKANDICAAEPERVARRLVDDGYTTNYDQTLQSLVDLPFRAWRDYDPEDAMRFYALRLHEVGLLNSTPNQIIADGTDWRFLNELKRELKA